METRGVLGPSRWTPISIRRLVSTRGTRALAISHTHPSCSSPLSPPYHHDIHFSHSFSHPRILHWPTVTTSCFSRPISNGRALLRRPQWVQVTRGHYPQLYRDCSPLHLGIDAPKHPKSSRGLTKTHSATCRTYASCSHCPRSSHCMGI
jgi:hypothetical protein